MRLFGNSNSVSGQKKSGSSNVRQLAFQPLEERRLMAADITVVSAGYYAGAPYAVNVTGTDSADTITMDMVGGGSYYPRSLAVTITDTATGKILKQATFASKYGYYNSGLPTFIRVSALGGNDTIINNTGIRMVADGGTGADLILGGTGGDELHGGANNDVLYGRGGNDSLYGEAGIDWISGGIGDDSLYGGDNDDYLTGDAGNDHLYGEAGLDVLYGGDNDDWLDGGYDGKADVMHGGAGRDTFVRRVSSPLSFGWVVEGENVLDFNAVDDVFSDVTVPLLQRTSLTLSM